MSPAAVIAEARASGVAFVITGDAIEYTGPPQALTDDLRLRVRVHCPAIFRLLKAEADAMRQRDKIAQREYILDLTTSKFTRLLTRDFAALLRRVSTAYEWTQDDKREFMRWAWRSHTAMGEARDFLLRECAKLDARKAAP